LELIAKLELNANDISGYESMNDSYRLVLVIRSVETITVVMNWGKSVACSPTYFFLPEIDRTHSLNGVQWRQIQLPFREHGAAIVTRDTDAANVIYSMPSILYCALYRPYGHRRHCRKLQYFFICPFPRRQLPSNCKLLILSAVICHSLKQTVHSAVYSVRFDSVCVQFTFVLNEKVAL